jgi:hypothetical protein
MGGQSMSTRIASYVVVPVILVAGVLGLRAVDNDSGAAAAASRGSTPSHADTADVPLADRAEALPPNHPPIGAASSPHGPRASSISAAAEAPAVAWKVPPGWQESPSPNAMRLATYRAPGGVEVTVSRAGGATEANIQRWISQFDEVGREDRVEKTVNGLRVVTATVAGTYLGGGMAIGQPAEPKRDWALVGAIVECRGPSYFFKMTGPATAVRASRTAFDRVVDAVTPL